MDNKIGDKIRHRRKQIGLTLKELAGDRVTAAQISAVEKGKCKPSPGLLDYIAEKLQIDVEYFSLSEEERYRKDFEKYKDESLVLIENGRYDEAEECIEQIFETFGYLNDQQKGCYYYTKANCLYKKALYKEAFEDYIKALTYYLKTKDIESVSDIYIKTGNCLCNTQKYDMALGYYLSASKYIDNNLDCDIVTRILYDLSICYLSLKRFDLAKEYYNKCLDFINSSELENKENYYAGLDMIKGILDLEWDKEKVSFQNFNEAFEKYKKENDIRGMGRAINNVGIWFVETEDKEKAIECFEKAIKYKIESNDDTLSDSYINLAETYRDIGSNDKAMDIINSAEESMLSSNNSRGLIDVMMMKFKFLMDDEDYEKAEMTAFIILDCIQKISDEKAESKLYAKMSEMYKKLGDEEASIQYLLKSNKISI